MTSRYRNVSRITGSLWGESIGDGRSPPQMASNVDLWCFIWCIYISSYWTEVELLVIWDEMTLMWRHGNDWMIPVSCAATDLQGSHMVDRLNRVLHWMWMLNTGCRDLLEKSFLLLVSDLLDSHITQNRDCKCDRPFPHGQRFWAFTPSGGGDMEIQKACLFYNIVTSSVCLRHN